MSNLKQIADVPAQDLGIALLEAIQEHARYHQGGVVKLEDVLAAVTTVSANFLTDIRDSNQRDAHLFSLLCCIKIRTIAKAIRRFAKQENTTTQ
jgi:hypothetical protein